MLFRSQGFSRQNLDSHKVELTAPALTGFLITAFNKYISSADSTFASNFIQGIKNGNLDPERYGCLYVLDAYYCYRAASSMWTAAEKVKNTDSEAYELLTDLYNNYNEYNKVYLEHWHLQTFKDIMPTDNFRLYADHEAKQAAEEDVLYFLVSLLPCYYLWAWMANKIDADSSSKPGLYQFWVDGNKGEAGSATVVDNFINSRTGTSVWNLTKAEQVFSTSLGFESRVFNEGGYNLEEEL